LLMVSEVKVLASKAVNRFFEIISESGIERSSCS